MACILADLVAGTQTWKHARLLAYRIIGIICMLNWWCTDLEWHIACLVAHWTMHDDVPTCLLALRHCMANVFA